MSVSKLDLDKNLLSFELVDENNKYHSFTFEKSNKFDLKNKIKEYKKLGTVTFSVISDDKIINHTFHPKYIRISKIVEMYINESNN